VRAESGNAISKEKPSLLEGAAGCCGGAGGAAASRADCVSAPIVHVVTVGDVQARRVPRVVLLVARIVRLRKIHARQEFKGVHADLARWPSLSWPKSDACWRRHGRASHGTVNACDVNPQGGSVLNATGKKYQANGHTFKK